MPFWKAARERARISFTTCWRGSEICYRCWMARWVNTGRTWSNSFPCSFKLTSQSRIESIVSRSLPWRSWNFTSSSASFKHRSWGPVAFLAMACSNKAYFPALTSCQLGLNGQGITGLGAGTFRLFSPRDYFNTFNEHRQMLTRSQQLPLRLSTVRKI